MARRSPPAKKGGAKRAPRRRATSAAEPVTDTGIGIAPEDQEAVFEEFRQVGTAAKKVEGTGLGLALSRKFAELHDGRLWVRSGIGEGSTFTPLATRLLPDQLRGEGILRSP